MTKLQHQDKLYQQVRPTTCLWIISRLAQDKILVGVQTKKHSSLKKAKKHLEGYTEYGVLPTSFKISASYNQFCDVTWSSLPLFFRLVFYFQLIHSAKWGTTVAQWLRCCATSRKVTGSIPDGVIGIFHWHNPSNRTMALGSTQPLTDMSTRSISWG